MTTPNLSPEPRQNGLKSLIVKGLAGALALAGTTGIPILVKQSLEKPPEPVASPSTPAMNPSPPAGANPPMPTTQGADPNHPTPLQPVVEGAVTPLDSQEGPDGKHKPKKSKGKKE